MLLFSVSLVQSLPVEILVFNNRGLLVIAEHLKFESALSL